MIDLGVYISSLDEERLISPCIKSIQKHFPQVELIDLGSADDTVKIAESLGVKVNSFENVSGRDWTDLKNQFSEKHEWVFWIDGDEIYPDESIVLMKNMLENGVEDDCIRISWIFLKEEEGKKYRSTTPKINGSKMFKPSKFRFERAWPREVLYKQSADAKRASKSEYNNVWCWHGVCLIRSSVEERKHRRLKREAKLIEYKDLDWVEIDKFPWEEE